MFGLTPINSAGHQRGPMHLPQAKLDSVLDRFHQVEARMSAAADGAEIVRLSKEHAELRPVADAVDALVRARADVRDTEEMAASGDPEMAALAREELQTLNARLPELEREVALLLAPKDKDENASVILEVRAGTGGDEAALFAGDLFRMYQRYAQTQGWRVEVDSVSEGEVGGYKEIIASINGDGVFGRLKFESGVHRVQRVPDTETQGRIHTSAATVAAEVWIRPWLSVAGTRCTLCTPLSNFSRPNTPSPVTEAMISL